MEKLAQTHKLKKAGHFFIGMLDKCQEDNLIGVCFGDLLVINKLGHKRKNNIIWECKCKCGNKLTVASTLLRSGKTTKCRRCIYEIKSQERIKSKKGQAKNTWWNKFSKDAFIRGKNITITEDYIQHLFDKQSGICALSGMKLEMPTLISGKRMGNGSLDRIYNTKDYCEDNCQWLHKDINLMKHKHSDEYFIKLCCMVADHYRGDIVE